MNGLSLLGWYGMAAPLSLGAGMVSLLTSETSFLLAPVVFASLRGGRGPGLLAIELAIVTVSAVESRDRGSGIEDPESVFEPFFTTKADGMGMGLAICRSIVEAHEGMIWVAKADPVGTVFGVALPVHSEVWPVEERS